MDIQLENPSPIEPAGPVLSSSQREVLATLRRRETSEYPLSEWYLGALYALANFHNPDRLSQAAQSLRELVEKLPRVVQESDSQIINGNFPEERRQIHAGFTRDRERYPDGWRGEQIDSRLEKTLNRAARYFEANQQPTRREQIQSAITNLDPLFGQMDSDIRQRKLRAIYDVWRRLEGFAHHRANASQEEFQDCLTTLEEIVLDLLSPITAQDQSDIQSILALPNRTEDDERRMIELIERTGANYAFFFANVEDPSWISILESRGYFSHPQPLEPQENGGFIVPHWPPVHYLSKVAVDDPEEAVRIALKVPEVDNPRVYDSILSIALEVPGHLSVRLKSKVIEYARMDFHFMAYRFRKLLIHWTREGETSSALELAKVLVRFRSDPNASVIEQYRKDDPGHYRAMGILMPSPAFDEWEYAEILERGVRPLSEEEPYAVARDLISATARLLDLKTYRDEIEGGNYRDDSEIWCQRLTRPDDDRHRQSDEALVQVLTYACEKVFEKAPNSVKQLVQTLREQKWGLFDRIICHLYSRYPSEQTLPWIRDLILGYANYATQRYHYEYQLMVQSACEFFGERLLTEEERGRIFQSILNGPEYRRRLADQFSEDGYERYRRQFHLMQLRPFGPVLFGEYLDYFRSLGGRDDISDDDYYPFNFSGVETVVSRSPMSVSDLAALSDVDLLRYINEWDEERYERTDHLFSIDIKSLAEAFQEVFVEFIVPDERRLRFWIENMESISHPIYVKSMVSAMQKVVEAGDFEMLDLWLSFCEWILTRAGQKENDYPSPDAQTEGEPETGELSRSVCDFVESCLKVDINAPIVHRQRLASLLRTLCASFDYRLDTEKPVILNRDDQLTEAINNTRSRALQELFNFGFWIRRNDPSADVVEVWKILDTRFASASPYQLTRPERAMLGWRFDSAVILNEDWAVEHRSDFFPRDTLREWADAFGSFLLSHRPNGRTFGILKDEFRFAIKNTGELAKSEHPADAPIDCLGRHLFLYYLWGYFPLNGDDSLLEGYYLQNDKNDENRQYRGRLFDHAGRALANTHTPLDKNLEERVVAFFEWRIEVGDPTELGYFTLWLKAECLKPEWRLESYSRILDISRIEPALVMTQMDILGQLLPDHTRKVIECFLKVAQTIRQDGYHYLNPDTVKQILKAGLQSQEEVVRENATQARDNLLRQGWNLRDIED